MTPKAILGRKKEKYWKRFLLTSKEDGKWERNY